MKRNFTWTISALLRHCAGALCEGGKQLRRYAFEFLREHATHVQFAFDSLPFAPESSEQFEKDRKLWHMNGQPKESALGTFIRSKDYKDIADPVCDFIIDELDRMREDGQAIPIALCKNPGCTNLIMPERIAMKGYCSDVCKSARHRSEKPQAERNDYQWLFRRYQLVHPGKPKREWKEGPLRQDLARNAENFQRIKSDHENVPRIQKLIDKLEPYTR